MKGTRIYKIGKLQISINKQKGLFFRGEEEIYKIAIAVLYNKLGKIFKISYSGKRKK